MSNPWDILSEKFDGNKETHEIDADAADNILIAWPPIFELIIKHFKNRKDISILDYGCGAGAFCEKLWTMGYKKIIGMDSSLAMINVAQKNYGEHINFIRGSAEKKLTVEPIDVVVGIMVFQFVDEIEKVFKNLVDIIKPGGLLIFAVHNPAIVRVVLERKKKLFSDFDSMNKPNRGFINLGHSLVPIFIRTADEYNKIISGLGLREEVEVYPPFTDEFLAHYATEVPDVPNFLILGYVKK